MERHARVPQSVIFIKKAAARRRGQAAAAAEEGADPRGDADETLGGGAPRAGVARPKKGMRRFGSLAIEEKGVVFFAQQPVYGGVGLRVARFSMSSGFESWQQAVALPSDGALKNLVSSMSACVCIHTACACVASRATTNGVLSNPRRLRGRFHREARGARRVLERLHVDRHRPLVFNFFLSFFLRGFWESVRPNTLQCV